MTRRIDANRSLSLPASARFTTRFLRFHYLACTRAKSRFMPLKRQGGSITGLSQG